MVGWRHNSSQELLCSPLVRGCRRKVICTATRVRVYSNWKWKCCSEMKQSSADIKVVRSFSLWLSSRYWIPLSFLLEIQRIFLDTVNLMSIFLLCMERTRALCFAGLGATPKQFWIVSPFHRVVPLTHPVPFFPSWEAGGCPRSKAMSLAGARELCLLLALQARSCHRVGVWICERGKIHSWETPIHHVL